VRSADDRENAERSAELGDALQFRFVPVPLKGPPIVGGGNLRLRISRQRAFAKADEPDAFCCRGRNHLPNKSGVH